jgi:hypothetical protein
MPGENVDSDIARQSATVEYDKVRHSLTIYQAVELFAALGVPRSKRSVQRVCKQGHLDCVSIKGARGDQFFINRESVERYAEELRQIEAVASITAEPRHTAPQHATARHSAPERANPPEPVAVAPAVERERDESAAIIEQLRDENGKLRDENLNLRIDNRGKEQAISFITAQAREKDQHLQDMSYRLGVAETRVAQLEAPKVHDDAPRQSAPERATEPVDAIVMPEPAISEPAPPAEPEARPVEPQRSVLGRLFGQGRG